VLLGFLGLFFFSVFPIITAAAMDQVEKGSEASGTALLFAGGAVIGSLSPVIAGLIYQRNGFEGVVWFAGSIALVGAVLAVILPVKRRLGA
jgi:fucose permease